MMSQPRILAFAGSARIDSWNHKLVQIAAQGALAAGVQTTVLNLADYPLPLFDEDLEREQGTPENAVKLKKLFLEHHGLLIASPEYNSSVTPLLKNTIDWVSRRAEGEGRLAAYQGKFAAIMATSPGSLGGLRGLVHVRAILSSIGVTVLPDQIAVPNAMDAFNDQGAIINAEQRTQIEALGRNLASILQKTIE